MFAQSVIARGAAPFCLALLLVTVPLPWDSAIAQHPTGHHADADTTTLSWRMPSMPGMSLMMLPGMAEYRPDITPFLPGLGLDPMNLPRARPREVATLGEGDTLHLRSALVRRTILGKTFTMYGFNGQYPGPLIRVMQNTTIVVDFTNDIELPTTIHWHGVRLDNRFDGVPGVTQDLVPPGGRFVYQVHFPDAGVYWYHPHHREDIQQELGLYGNMLVDPGDSTYYSLVHREEILMLDDLLLQEGGIAPFGLETSNHTLMGRFGNVFLVNGEPTYQLSVDRGEVVRFFLTNVSNTRMYNLQVGGARVKAIAGDIGKFEREAWVPSVVLAPAERYVVEARFDQPGTYALTNRVQALNHLLGEFYGKVDTLGTIRVSDRSAVPDYGVSFDQLRANSDVAADIARYRPHFSRSPDFELDLTIRVGQLPQGMIQYMSIDTTYFPPVEWNDAMPMMNWFTNGTNIEWLLRDARSGAENMDIAWRLPVGEVTKIRLRNDEDAFHPMSHPIHLHGQRFLVVERDGRPNPNLVWKETVLVPVGSTIDLLVDVSNPGKWMLHCHIAEHLEAGMRMIMTVEDQSR